MGNKGQGAVSRAVESSKEQAGHFVQFVNKTGSPFHVVSVISDMLIDAGFVRLNEAAIWNLVSGGKYFVTRNMTSINAFVIGKKFENNNTGRFIIAATHTDSPCLRLRPRSTVVSEKYIQLGVDCYGGGLWNTWFDRGLGLAGKLVLKRNNVNGVEERLIRISDPICIIPSLCIHLQSANEKAENKIDREINLRPILCSLSLDQIMLPECTQNSAEENGNQPSNRYPSCLLKRLAQEVSCEPSEIVDVDLYLMDATESRLCGIYEEFIESPRLDNLANLWPSFIALTQADTENSCDIISAVAFDHEEVGSVSLTGASSVILETWLTRISNNLGFRPDDLAVMLSKSFVISADMSHAVHPNYAAKHQNQHKATMNEGIILKTNVNQRYATFATGSAICRTIASMADPPVPILDFVVRNDSSCGSTIGPTTSARLGVRTIDLGIPQLAMHSCREMCGCWDLTRMICLIRSFYQNFSSIDTASIYL